MLIFFPLEMNQKNPGDVSKWQCEMSDNNIKHSRIVSSHLIES